MTTEIPTTENTMTGLETPRLSYQLIRDYPEDSMREFRVLLNEKPQEAKHLVMVNPDGSSRILAQHSLAYKVVPFSATKKTADLVASEIGAVPFDEFKGKWFAKADKNVMYNNKQTEMHALYAFNEPVQIQKGDSLQLGFSVHNSLDKSTGFGGGFFTFRHACANMFFMGLNGRGMSFDTRKTLAWFSVAHTKERTNEDLRKMMTVLTDQGMRIVNAIRALKDFNLEKVEAERILDVLPKSKVKELKWAKYTEEGKATLDESVTVNKYDVWNDMTDYLSHNDLGLETMMWKMKRIDSVLVTPLIRA